jgi:peptidoglycan/LPS O-acetylase OafA/YrhL
MKKNYYPSINMLRGIAALLVCIYHFTNYTGINGDLFVRGGRTQSIGEYGILGVYIFFIITGFVIPLALFKYDFRLSQLHKFLTKRWIRIEIPYITSIVLILLVSFAFSIKNESPFVFSLTKLFHNIFYSASFFDFKWYNPIYWTLAIEMQFYILIALVFPLIKNTNHLLNCIIPITLTISSLVIDDYRFVFFYGSIFSQGILLLLIMRYKINSLLGVIVIGFSSIITIYVHGLDIAIVSLITVFVIAFLNIDKKLLNQLGDISYSLYLIHGLVGVNLIYLLARYCKSFTTKVGLVVMALFLSILAAVIYYRIIEKHSKKWSQKITLKNHP